MSEPDSTAPAAPSASTGAASAAPAGEPMLTVNGQYIKDFSFESPHAPAVFANPAAPPQVQVGVDVGARQIGERVYEVTLSINAEAKAAEQAVFVVEIAYAGLFSIPALPPEQLRPLLLIECPRLLFPFARAIIADATRDGGFPPLMIQPIDFAELYRRQAAAQAPSSPISASV
ncbi:MAG: protein-export chaperone SecB [Pseudomonadota bacterium]